MRRDRLNGTRIIKRRPFSGKLRLLRQQSTKADERNALERQCEYVGIDVHRDTISVAVLDEDGRLMMQSVLATRAAAILDFISGLRGTLHVTFEEGTHRLALRSAGPGG